MSHARGEKCTIAKLTRRSDTDSRHIEGLMSSDEFYSPLRQKRALSTRKSPLLVTVETEKRYAQKALDISASRQGVTSLHRMLSLSLNRTISTSRCSFELAAVQDRAIQQFSFSSFIAVMFFVRALVSSSCGMIKSGR